MNEREELEAVVAKSFSVGSMATAVDGWKNERDAARADLAYEVIDALITRPDLVLAVLVEAGVARTGWTVPWGVVWDDDGDPLPPGLPRVFALRSRGSEVG